MSYKFIRITTYYDGYLKNYYENFPDVIHLTYEEQLQHLSDNSVELTTSFNKCLKKLGVDSSEIISNAIPLQQRWAKEHNLDEDCSLEKLISEQIKFYKPDIVWIDTTKLFNKAWVQSLRDGFSFLKLIVGHICSPYNSVIENSFSSFDIMFTCTACTKKELSEAGLNTELIYHSFDPSILDLVKHAENNFPQIDFLFTGSLYTGYGMHKSRIEYIEKILDSGIDLTIFGNLETYSKVLLKQSVYYIINFLKNIKCDFIIDGLPILKNMKSMGKIKLVIILIN